MFQHNANPCRSSGFCGNNFAFILVLFILLVIIGASWVF